MQSVLIKDSIDKYVNFVIFPPLYHLTIIILLLTLTSTAGLSVRAFVRDPAKLPAHLADKVEVLQGNVLEPDSVHDAIEGVDAVVIALGTRNALEPTSDLSEV